MNQCLQFFSMGLFYVSAVVIRGEIVILVSEIGGGADALP
jgi:hypothetical protein